MNDYNFISSLLHDLNATLKYDNVIVSKKLLEQCIIKKIIK